ncbi:MAG: hypothetical protein RMM98_02225 [Acidobacteriota bacterium]|nr:hypothetical protein [Blastocatellia bacterium]MDW8238405.1 hypothetical protein [Acidobacteriota bacterium]
MKRITIVSALLLTLGCLLLTSAEASQKPKKAVAKRATLKVVKPNLVCMVNNTVFSREQIPVEVDGKTYYGCCEMCKSRLANDEAVRYAVDPVTNKKIDKATAVIGAKADGSVLYFESEKTLKQYSAGGAQ